MSAGVETVQPVAFEPETLGSLWARIGRGDLVRLAVVAGQALAAAVASWLTAPWWAIVVPAGAGLAIAEDRRTP